MADITKAGDKVNNETPQQSHAEKLFDDVHQWLKNHDYSNLKHGQSPNGLPELLFTHGNETISLEMGKDRVNIISAPGKNLSENALVFNGKEYDQFDKKGRVLSSDVRDGGFEQDEKYDATSGELISAVKRNSKTYESVSEITAQHQHAQHLLQDVREWLAKGQVSDLSTGKTEGGRTETRFMHANETFTVATAEDGSQIINRSSGKNLDGASMLSNAEEYASFDKDGRLMESTTYHKSEAPGLPTIMGNRYERYEPTTGNLLVQRENSFGL